MADKDEKTEPATARKREESRGTGKVAKSVDLVQSLQLLVFFTLVYFIGGWWRDQALLASWVWLSDIGRDVDSVEDLNLLFLSVLRHTAVFMIPTALCLLLTGVLGNLMQTGWLVAWKALQPDITKLDPIKGFSRIFSLRGVMRFVTSLLKISCAGTVAWWTLSEERASMLGLVGVGPHAMVAYMGELIFKVGLRISIVYFLLSLLDLLYQQWQNEEDMKMTKQEVKDEMKQMEGDPKIKARVRELQRKMSLQRMMQKVPEATVVVTNPTRIAVALRYEVDVDQAPICVAKGKEGVAKRIRQLAAEHGIPIVERKPLARALYEAVEVGAIVPEHLYGAVAEILAYVYELEQRLRPTRAA